jgi:hypothetical protein
LPCVHVGRVFGGHQLDVTGREVVSLVKGWAVDAELVAPGSRWYLFGSGSRGCPFPNDIDILVVYGDDSHAFHVRRRVAGNTVPPVHLLMMRVDEEAELEFVKKQQCIEIFPQDRFGQGSTTQSE